MLTNNSLNNCDFNYDWNNGHHYFTSNWAALEYNYVEKNGQNNKFSEQIRIMDKARLKIINNECV